MSPGSGSLAACSPWLMRPTCERRIESPWCNSHASSTLCPSQSWSINIGASVGLTAAVASLTQAILRPPEIDSLLTATSERADLADRYVKAYQRYCWNVSGVDDLRLAPFHFLVSEGALAPRARVRVRRPGDGERTRRPEVVMNPAPRVVRAVRKGFQS